MDNWTEINRRIMPLAVMVAMSLGLAACGSSTSSTTYTVSGDVTGLDAGYSVTLLDNGGDGYVATADGSFTFSTALADGASYAVTVGTQPTNGQTCSVSHGSGKVSGANVTQVSVVCVTHGLVSTLAGSTASGAVDGTGSAAQFNGPNDVAVDTAGNVYVADANNNEIRKVTPGGVVTTFAGATASGSSDGTGTAARFNYPTALAVDASGNIYVADTSNNEIRKITPTGVVTTFAGSTTSGSNNGVGTAAQFSGPSGVAVDAAGNLYVADTGNDEIRKITPSGTVSTLAGSAGLIGSTDGTGTAARFNSPVGIAVDGSGNIYVGDSANNEIRKITSAGVVTTLAGTTLIGSADGTGPAAGFNYPNGVATDASGNVYVADYANNEIRKVTPAGVVTTFAGSTTSGSADGVGTAALFNSPAGVAVDASGNIYVADFMNNEIRKITP